MSCVKWANWTAKNMKGSHICILLFHINIVWRPFFSYIGEITLLNAKKHRTTIVSQIIQGACNNAIGNVAVPQLTWHCHLKWRQNNLFYMYMMIDNSISHTIFPFCFDVIFNFSLSKCLNVYEMCAQIGLVSYCFII